MIEEQIKMHREEVMNNIGKKGKCTKKFDKKTFFGNIRSLAKKKKY